MEKETCEDCGNELPAYRRSASAIMGDGSFRFLCDVCWGEREKFSETHGYFMPNPRLRNTTFFELHDAAIENRKKYANLLAEQIGLLRDRGCHTILRKTMDEFSALFKPLARNLFLLQDLPDFDEVVKRGEIPLVPVFPFSLLAFSTQVELTGITSSYMVPLFSNINLFSGMPYLALGISQKRGTATPPLVFEEGFSVVMHFREKFLEWKAMAFPGSVEGGMSAPYMLLLEDQFTIHASEGHVYPVIQSHGYFSCSRRIFV